MKKTILAICLLTVSLLGYSQHRTYLKVGVLDMQEDMYITRDVDGQYFFHIQLWNWSNFQDSVFVALDKSGCDQMKNALSELNTKYRKWTSSARLHKIRDYSRPFDIVFPEVVFKWRTEEKTLFGPQAFGSERNSRLVSFPQPLFSVDSEGQCSVKLEPIILDGEDGSGQYEFSTCFSSSAEIRGLIKRCNTSWAIKEYNKANQSRPEEYYDAIFK